MKPLLNNIISIVCLICCAACSVQQKYVPIYQKDTVYISNNNTEYIKDSVLIFKDRIIREKNDTVYIENTIVKYKDKLIEKAVHDTIYTERVKTEIIVQTVEKELTNRQKVLMDLGKISIFLIVAFFVVIGIRLYRKIKL